MSLSSEMAVMLASCGAPRDAATAEGADAPREDDANARVVFAEPWHAEAVATTLHLSRKGLFTWKEWVQVFSREIAQAPQAAAEDANSAYYRQWLAALQTMLTSKRVLDLQDIARTQEDWRKSYLHTQHGEPVVFRRELPDLSEDEQAPHDHDHHDHHHDGHGDMPAPVAISPARR